MENETSVSVQKSSRWTIYQFILSRNKTSSMGSGHLQANLECLRIASLLSHQEARSLKHQGVKMGGNRICSSVTSNWPIPPIRWKSRPDNAQGFYINTIWIHMRFVSVCFWSIGFLSLTSKYVLNLVPSTPWVFTSIVEVGSEVNSQILFSMLLIVTKANVHHQLAAPACLFFSWSTSVKQSNHVTPLWGVYCLAL